MLIGIPASFGDGQVIFRQGDAAADMYVIRSGSVRISRVFDDGEDKVLAYLSEGDFFGEMALFQPGPRTATATAVGDVEVEAVDRPSFLDALDRDESLKDLVAEISLRIKSHKSDPGTAPEQLQD